MNMIIFWSVRFFLYIVFVCMFVNRGYADDESLLNTEFLFVSLESNI
jgi:hypothetical protein